MAIKYDNTGLFKFIGFPLNNVRTDWGAQVNNTIVLRVWNNQRDIIDGKKYIEVLNETGVSKSVGLAQRRKHIEAVINGADCFISIVTCVDASEDVWSIKSTVQAVFTTGGFITIGAKTYIEYKDKVELRTFKQMDKK